MAAIGDVPCLRCGNGVLIPLSDYGLGGAPILFKAWVCTNPACGYNLRIDRGEISVGPKVGPRVRRETPREGRSE